jgi:catechol 2,3-dioxygenase-like lactoylglutathione lyase family enzyme
LSAVSGAVYAINHSILAGGGSMSASTNALAPYLYQVSYVVRDMDATQEWFKKVLGIRHFGTFDVFMGNDYNFKMRGKPHPGIGIKVAMARLGARGAYELEIIAPEAGDNIYNEFLDKHGPGLHHVAYVVPDYEQAAAPVRAAGMTPLIEFDNGGSQGGYFDCGPAGGSVIEIVKYDPATVEWLEGLKTPPADAPGGPDPLADYWFQVAYLSRDFKGEMDFFKRVIGVQYFLEMDFSLGPQSKGKVRGQALAHPYAQKVALGNAGQNGENEYEIITPLEPDNIYSELIDERGPGIHHLSFMVPDHDKFAARVMAGGGKPIIEIDQEGFKGTYFDCRAAGASYIEIAQYSQENKAAIQQAKTPPPA